MDIVICTLPWWGELSVMDLLILVNLFYFILGWFTLRKMKRVTAKMVALNTELCKELERLADTDEK